MVKLLENRRLIAEGYSNVVFIRLEPEDLSVTIRDIIDSLQNLSWINKFDKKYKRRSFQSRSIPTVNLLKSKLENHDNDSITTEIGETVVSELSRSSLINYLNYADIPLAELIKQQISGNPGFDFFSETLENAIVFGEAKYLSQQNAYGNAMKQVNTFIREERDLTDLKDIEDFVTMESLENASMGSKKAYACGFSSTAMDTEVLIQHILNNKYHKYLSSYNELIYIAVNV